MADVSPEIRNRIEILLNEWHEAGRIAFEAIYKSLVYDTYTPKKVVYGGSKWVKLDNKDSGVFMLRLEDGLIFRIKAYGTPHLKKCVGHINSITGADLNRLSTW